jgi:hypothetical protein
MLKPNYALDFQPICTFFPWGEGIEDTELQPFLDFQPILFLLPVGEGIEDTEPQPCLGFSANLYLLPVREGLRISNLSHLGISSQFCPLSPWERVRERAVSRRLTFRFRKKSSESSLQQEIAHSETVAANFICVQDKRKVV